MHIHTQLMLIGFLLILSERKAHLVEMKEAVDLSIADDIKNDINTTAKIIIFKRIEEGEENKYNNKRAAINTKFTEAINTKNKKFQTKLFI